MERAVLLDAVILQGVAVFKLRSGVDQLLLIRGNTLLVLNLCFDIFNPDVYKRQILYCFIMLINMVLNFFLKKKEK